MRGGPGRVRRQSRAGRRAHAAPADRDGNVVKRGDILRIETGGGGGWGHPFDREPERVLADVRGGFVSRESAAARLRRRADGDGRAVDACGHATAPRAAARRPSCSTVTDYAECLDDHVQLDDACAMPSASTPAARSPTSPLLDPATGRVWGAKTPSTPDDPSRGFCNGVDRGAEDGRLAGADSVARVLHGTTVATNLILEGKGAPAGADHHAGFRHVLEIGRQDIPRRANLFAWVKPTRPVPPEHIFEVAGAHRPGRRRARAARRGSGARGGARDRTAGGIGAVAVCCCTATPNPAHERRVAATLARGASRRRWSRSRATCCRCSASTSAA